MKSAQVIFPQVLTKDCCVRIRSAVPRHVRHRFGSRPETSANKIQDDEPKKVCFETNSLTIGST